MVRTWLVDLPRTWLTSHIQEEVGAIKWTSRSHGTTFEAVQFEDTQPPFLHPDFAFDQLFHSNPSRQQNVATCAHLSRLDRCGLGQQWLWRWKFRIRPTETTATILRPRSSQSHCRAFETDVCQSLYSDRRQGGRNLQIVPSCRTQIHSHRLRNSR